jgi:uncharacterized protein YcaQ
VRGAYGEPGIDVDEVVPSLLARLREMATFLDLADVRIERKGDLARPLIRGG